jgi:precorrin-6x reductase
MTQETDRCESAPACAIAGVLITKDSGDAGGFGEKLAAARKKGCQVVVVQRPVNGEIGTFADIGELVQMPQYTMLPRFQK